MSPEITIFCIEKFCSVLDLEKDSDFPHKTQFQALKDELEEAKEHIIGPDTNEGLADELCNKLYDLHDLLLECLARPGNQHSTMLSMVDYCTPFKPLSQHNRIRILKNQIEETLRKIKGLKIETTHPPEVEPEKDDISKEEEEFYEYTTSYVDESRIYGRVEEADKIAKKISESENFTATAIVGICGSGKTTLAQKVFVHDKMKDKFPVRLWVCIGPDCKKEELLYRMLDNLGLDVEEVMEIIKEVEVVKTKEKDEDKERSKIGVLLYILYLQLLPKGYLIVFDDVREDMHPGWYQNLTTQQPMDKEWYDRFAYGLPKIKDSAVIVTCRKEEFARNMVDAGGIYNPERLREEEAWLVFKRSFEEAMNKALEKDKTKVKKELEIGEKEIDNLESEIKVIKKEIEDKSHELKEINDEMSLNSTIEADLKDTKKVIGEKEEQLVEAEKKLEEVRRDYENGKSLEEIEKEIGAKNEHLDEVKDEPEDVKKVILDDIAELTEQKKHINEKKEKFERSKNEAEEIRTIITDKKKEEANKETELAEKIEAITKKSDKKTDLDKVIMEKQNIVDRAEENAKEKKEQLKKKMKADHDELEKREKDLKERTNGIIEDLKLEKMKEQIRKKCLGLPVALIEAAKGLAFEEYTKSYHADKYERQEYIED